MSIKIVLYNPLIPQNTGSTARLTAANNLPLHLIEPLGFDLSDRYMKRAGLDYWKEVNLTVHKSWDEFLNSEFESGNSIYLSTTKGEKSLFDINFKFGDILVFGSESSGLPEDMHERYKENRFKIPMKNDNIRSLNLATSVGIVSYEAMRQIELK